MLTNQEFQALLQDKGTLVLDGALATELEKRGHDLNHALWSAKLLQDDPQSILDVHLDYYLAGADIAITASYQASTQGLIDHFALSPEQAAAFVSKSVELAQQARTHAYDRGVGTRRLFVAGSVGPYGAYLADGSEYRGDYTCSADDFKTFHRARIAALLRSDVDLLAVETMPNLREIQAVLELLVEEFPEAIAWITCTVADAQHLSDGSPLGQVVDLILRHRERVVAVGLNCVSTTIVTQGLRTMSAAMSEYSVPLICYPNSGEVWDANTKTWHAGQAAQDGFGGLVDEWRSLGAKLIGGCCRTGPSNIEAVVQALRG